MAEAVVEDPSRFFCHKCSREISSVLPDYTCPQCCSGFIEALDGQTPAADQGEESEEDVDVVQPWEILNEVLFMGGNGDLLPDPRRGRGRRGREGERRPGRNQRSRHSFENLMHLFVMNLNADIGAHGNLQAGRAGVLGPEIFVGNPGDYAWGREGFDAIVTQLLNQIESTGPPPLTKEKIQEIPVVSITQEQVDMSLQCSVCWENFKLDEPVRQLVCTHVYHEGCIIPWLELHGTCPVCRKPLSSEAEQATTDESGRRDTLRSLAASAANAANAAAESHLRNHIRQNIYPRVELEDIRNRYSTRLANPPPMSGMQSMSDTSAASTSSDSAGVSTPSSSNTGNSSSHGNIQDMDVD